MMATAAATAMVGARGQVGQGRGINEDEFFDRNEDKNNGNDKGGRMEPFSPGDAAQED
jgi:hypothetical protein